MISKVCSSRFPVIVFLATVLSLPAALPGMCDLEAVRPDPARQRVFSFNLPAEVNPKDVILLVGAYGQGLALESIRTEEDKYSYTHRFPDWTTSVKILAHYPGAKMVAEEFAANDPALSQPLYLAFQPLPTVPLTLKLVDSRGKPIAGQKFMLNQELGMMEYFNYGDGMVMSGKVLPAKVRRDENFVIYYESPDSFTTDAEGKVKLQLPSLQDDPYYEKVGVKRPSFGIHVPARDSEGGHGFAWYPTPAAIPAQSKYEKPITVTMTYYGRLEIALSEKFLDEQAVPVEARKDLKVEVTSEESGVNCTLDDEGNGLLEWVSPGTYKVVLRVPAAGDGIESGTIVLEKHIYVGEREVVRIER